MNLRHKLTFVLIGAVSFWLAGCGGGGSSPNPPSISVTLNPNPPSSVQAGKTASLTAIVSNDTANGGVKWSVVCASGSCGSFSIPSTASGAATTYAAPASVPGQATVTVPYPGTWP